MNEIQIPLVTVRSCLLQQNLLQDLHKFCLQCLSNPEECIKLKIAIQKLMDEGVLQIERVVPRDDIVVLEIPYYPVNV